MGQGYRLGDFPCKTRANTQKFNNRYNQTFPTGMKKAFCPYCNCSVNEQDPTCWKCKKVLSPETLDHL